MKVADPLGYNITEMVIPDNALYCGLLKERQKYVSACLFLPNAVLHFTVLDLQLTSCSKNPAGHRFMSQTASRRRKVMLDGATNSSQP